MNAPHPSDATIDLSPNAPMVRARRGRVTIEVGPVAVQSEDAARVLGIGVDVLRAVPFSVLPYRRIGTKRWYLVRTLHHLAEQLMAEQIAHGVPASRERFGQRVFQATEAECPS